MPQEPGGRPYVGPVPHASERVNAAAIHRLIWEAEVRQYFARRTADAMVFEEITS